VESSARGRRQPPQEKRRIIYVRTTTANFQPHHQPFKLFCAVCARHRGPCDALKDGEDFVQASIPNLPQVAFYKPAGRLNQHPSYTDSPSAIITSRTCWRRLKQSPQWNEMAVIVTYDENGGFWDHVPPPQGTGWGDRFGPGTRIPTSSFRPMQAQFRRRDIL